MVEQDKDIQFSRIPYGLSMRGLPRFGGDGTLVYNTAASASALCMPVLPVPAFVIPVDL